MATDSTPRGAVCSEKAMTSQDAKALIDRTFAMDSSQDAANHLVASAADLLDAENWTPHGDASIHPIRSQNVKLSSGPAAPSGRKAA